jgi:FlaA1/EpsC-like NDP-sugar epimerase
MPTAHESIFRLKNENGTDEEAEVWLSELRTVASEGDQQTIKRLMNQLVPEYTPCIAAQSEKIVQAVGIH